jgi:hypothetical protein
MMSEEPENIVLVLLRGLREDLNGIKRELADMRDDRMVMIAILNRLDASYTSMTIEMRALRSQFDRFRNEVRERIKTD